MNQDEINKIIDNLEGCIGIFDYLLTPNESNLLVLYIKELKQKYENAVADYETTMAEKEQLKKQLEAEIKLRNKILINCVKLENQQKEFIDYMNKTIEELECDDVDDEEMKGYLIQRIYTFKEILQKYKSIIGEMNNGK